MIIEHNSQLNIYRSPFGAVTSGEKVILRIGISGGGIPYVLKLHYKFKKEEKSADMYYIFEIGGMCIYETTLVMPDDVGLLWYYFEIKNDNGHFYYSNNLQNLGGIGAIYEEKPEIAYQITVYSPDFTTPEWFRKSVVYQIFPDRFYNGNENGEFLGNRTDIIKRSWGEVPYYKPEQFGGEYRANDFYGGNLKGIEKKLDYLAELGVGALYLNPIFKAYSNHKYDTGNYMEIDPSFGTQEDFERLCKKAEEFGIKIVLDGVFNHTGSNSLYFNKDGEYESLGAYQSNNSPFYEWFTFTEYPEKYESWWGMKTLPSVNEKTESYRDYIINSENSVVKHWLRKGAGGWRLDVVDELPGFFVKELRNAVKSVDNDAVIIGEVWEDASNKCSYGEQREYFLGAELDSVMNYPLRSAFIDLARRNIDAVEFDKRIMSLKENYPRPAYYALLNFLSSHDVERIMTAVSDAPQKYSVNKDFMAGYRLEGDEFLNAVKRVRQIVMMIMLMPGVPCIFYGDERGMEGYADPFCRGCIDWNNCNDELMQWYKKAISVRKSSPVFVNGEFETLYKENYSYAFIRYIEDERYIVCANFSAETQWMRIDVARLGITCLDGEITEEKYCSTDGVFYIEMAPGDIKVFMGK